MQPRYLKNMQKKCQPATNENKHKRYLRQQSYNIHPPQHPERSQNLIRNLDLVYGPEEAVTTLFFNEALIS